MIAMLEEAEDVLRRAGCDMTADKVRKVLQAQQADHIGDATEIAQQAEPVARDVLAAFGKEVKRACVKAWGAADESHEGNAIEECDITAIVDRYAAQPPAVAVPPALPDWMECDAKVQAGTANALERFVYANEPAGDSAAEFRAALLAILAAAPQAAPLSAALADIAAERRRQIEQERWTADRDDRLFNGQLATAAGYYALAAGWPHERDIGRGLKPQYWPFNQEWWKPTTARHNLVKAGALIAAEIERIDRAAQKGGEA